MNYKLTLQYDGTDFHGWQMQGDQRTVQGELTRVLALIEGAAVVVHGSGRTDAGVHAEGQVASTNLTREMPPEKLRAAINGNLERDVRVTEASIVPDDFHARYSARGKSYVYRIFNTRVMSPFWVRYALHETRALDLKRMQNAARLFLGEHDWSAFCSADVEAQTRTRTITQLEIEAHIDERGHGLLVELSASANGFLRYMMRSIAGTLMAVGRDEIDEQAISRAINTGNRSPEGVTAPAHGLTLREVHY